MPKEKAQAAPTARPKVPMRRRGADCPVVMKRGNARGAKGAGHRRWAWANWVKPGGARTFSGRRQPSCDGTSRMMREYQVRFCEGLGVKFPGSTRHFLPPSFVVGGGGCSSVSGRQKTRFSEKPASIDENDRVGMPLVRYFEVAAISAPLAFR